MMGTGKTAVARGLADRLGRYSFLDTDHIIEQVCALLYIITDLDCSPDLFATQHMTR
jgi:shikimate kinase